MKTNPHSTTRSLVLAALFLALAFVLPMITGHVPQVGNMLCPMHFPILLCGFVLGGPWGLAVGFIAPLVRSVLFGMPPMFPIAIDDYEVTGIELDTLVEEAWKVPGVIGSRMTGAGFGGCTISIVRDEAIEEFIKQVGEAYEKKIGYAADFYVVEIGDGPCRLK